MTETAREGRLLDALASLASDVATGSDVFDLLQTLVDTCLDALDVAAAGLLLKNEAGELRLAVSTTEDTALIELVQLGAESGPCLECADSGRPVSVPDIAQDASRWPEFRAAALAGGFRSLQATPLRLRDDTIGTLNLFNTAPGPLDAADVTAAQALSDIATMGLFAERTARDHRAVRAQLQSALDSRIVIEQAKGVMAETLGIPMHDAFTLLRTFARDNGLTARALATALVSRHLDPERLIAPPTVPSGRSVS